MIEAAQLLIEEFNLDTCWNSFGSAFVSTCCYDNKGMGYVGGKWVRRTDLHGRRYNVCIVDKTTLRVELVDCLFRRDLWKWVGLTKEDRLRFRRAKRGVKFLTAYRLSKKYEESYKRRVWLTAVRAGRNFEGGSNNDSKI